MESRSYKLCLLTSLVQFHSPDTLLELLTRLLDKPFQPVLLFITFYRSTGKSLAF